jgi:hypothetical protein
MYVIAKIAGILAAFAVGACAMPDMDSFRAPDVSIFRPASVAALRETSVRSVTAEDLVDAEGRCGGAFASADQNPQGEAPGVAGGVALEMTECEVVRRTGQPERVALGSNERGERTATLTYIRGARPGTYSFVAGRLTSMERAPEPAPTRPARPARQPKRSTS